MRVGISVGDEELESAAEFCRDEGIGLEVTAFAYPRTLDEAFEPTLERHAAVLEGVPFLTFHGPFLDLYCTSPDPRVVDLCRTRHGRALEAAGSLGAELYVAHLNSNPLIRNRRYRERFVEGVAEFWRPFVEAARGDGEPAPGEDPEARGDGPAVVLENMWERKPDLQRRVVEAAAHPGLRASFDNGHALVFSRLTAAEWIQGLGDALAHLHLHDNDGEYDHHWVLGEGEEDWPGLLAALGEAEAAPVVILENDDLAAGRESLRRFREHAGRKSG